MQKPHSRFIKEPSPDALRALARRALAEDKARADRTTLAIFPRRVPAEARIVAQGTGILSGIRVAREIARLSGFSVTRFTPDGTRLRPGRTVLIARGDVRRILSSERTMLNFLMHLSGVATAAAEAVTRGRGITVYATRKTLPGLRDVEKVAVVHGGGRPHRRDLSSQILIKTNHLTFVSIAEAVRRARQSGGAIGPIEIEVRTPKDAVEAAQAGVNRLLIDNQPPAASRRIVRAVSRAGLRRNVWIELSGGITLDNVAQYGAVGADGVSMGALTHSARALPFHLTIRPLGRRPA